MNDSKLSVLLLGAPVVKWGDEIIHIQRRNQRALLYYLAGQFHPVGRSELMLLLWPEKPEEEARRFLREHLSKLRTELPDHDLLNADRELVWLDFNRVTVDVQEFNNLLNANRRTAHLVARNEPLPIQVYQELARAVNLWHGEDFLAGFEYPDTDGYDQWMSQNRQTLEMSRQFCLLRLADHAAAVGNLEENLQWMKLAVRRDEFNADLHFAILNDLLGLGRQAEAAAYYDYLRDLYQEDEGLPAVLAQLAGRLEKPRSGPAAPYPIPVPPHPMVGRIEELNQLRQAYNRGGLAVVLGESGSGKTRLGYEFYRALDPAPRLVFLDCLENHQSLPYQALVTALRQYVQPDDWAELNPTWRSHLALLLPELRIHFPEMAGPRTLNREESQTQAYEALYQLFAQVARKNRLLFIIDNAHWCDQATIQALGYLAGRGLFQYPNFAIVLTRMRNSGLGQPDMVNKPGRHFPQVLITLSQLSLKEMQDLCRVVLGEHLPADKMDRLALDTGGNPLYILEWLRAWSYRRPVDASSPEDLTPALGGLHSLMRSRLNELTPLGRQVLAAAAVLGSQFTQPQVEKVSGLKGEQITAGLEDLEHAHLIRLARDDNSYLFIHDRIREVVLMDLSLPRRRMLHTRAARMLQETSSSALNPDAARIAAHFEAGGEPLQAIYAWVEAARYALSLFSSSDAEAAIQHAEQLLKTHDRVLPDEVIYILYATWGRIAQETTRPEQARTCFVTLFRYGEQRRSRLLLGTANRGLAAYHLQTGSVEHALDHANQAVLLLDGLPYLKEQLEAFNLRGAIYTTLARYNPARQDLERAIALSRNSTDEEIIRLRSLAEAMLGVIYIYLGLPIRGIGMAQQARDDARRIQSEYAESFALVSLAMANFYAFRYDETLVLVEEGIRLSEPFHFWHNLGYLHTVRGMVLLARGELDLCWNELRSIHSIAVQHESPDLLPYLWMIRGQIHRFLWNFPAALEGNHQGETLALDAHSRLENIAQQATVLGTIGQYEQSLALFDRVLNEARTLGLKLVYLPAAAGRLGIFAPIFPVEQTLAEIEIFLQELADTEMEDLRDFIKYAQALVNLKQGNLEQALAYAAAFNEYAMHSGVPWLKVINLALQHIFATALDRPLGEEIRRDVRAVLDFLDAHVQNPDLRPHFEVFHSQILKLME